MRGGWRLGTEGPNNQLGGIQKMIIHNTVSGGEGRDVVLLSPFPAPVGPSY